MIRKVGKISGEERFRNHPLPAQSYFPNLLSLEQLVQSIARFLT